MSKIIVITGAGSGLGRALARRFAADGETLVLMGRRLANLEAVATEIGSRAHVVQCDVGDPDSVRTAFETVKDRCGRLDVLINNAGTFEPFLVAEATEAQILQSLATNLAGPILCTRAAIPLMGAGSQIINVTSETVAHAYYPFLSLYQCSKAGLEQFSKNLLHELAPQGIRVTIVRAGPMAAADMDWSTADLEQVARFHKAATDAGINLSKPPTDYNSVPAIFRTIIDLPADLITPMIALSNPGP